MTRNRYVLLACAFAALYGLPAYAQIVANLPVTCNAAGTICTQATPVTNPDGTTIGGGASPTAPSYVGPSTAPSTSAAGTIAVANTYQSVLAANTARKGCFITATSGASLSIFLGAPGSATAGTSIPLLPGQTFSCSSGVLVVSDQISIASATLSATYVVINQ